jgi:Fur family peroxide stress response transcriptional regulator
MEAIIKRYRAKGLKMTPQRLAIFKFLEGNTDHPTADDIFVAVKKQFPTVSFATIYNTLQVLSEKNAITEITINPERKHYDPNTDEHHHIVCTECSKIGDVFVDYSKVLSLPEDVLKSFSVKSNHVNFYAVCNDCAT